MLLALDSHKHWQRLPEQNQIDAWKKCMLQKMNSYQRFFLDVDYFPKLILRKVQKLAACVAPFFFTFLHLEKDHQKCNWQWNIFFYHILYYPQYIRLSYIFSCYPTKHVVFYLRHCKWAGKFKIIHLKSILHTCIYTFTSANTVIKAGLQIKIQSALLSLKINVNWTAN